MSNRFQWAEIPPRTCIMGHKPWWIVQNLEVMYVQCDICENPVDNLQYKIKEMMYGLDDVFDYFQCSSCGCLQIARTPHDMARYYPTSYYSFSNPCIEVRSSFSAQITRALRIKRDEYLFHKKGVLGRALLALVPESFVVLLCIGRLGLRKESRILDVGCGSGLLLRQMQECGFVDLTGIDPFVEEPVIGKRVKIFKKQIWDLEGEEFDLILLNDSLEHIPDQQRAFHSIYNLLSRAGTCIIKTPTVSSYAWEKYRKCWYGTDAPRHLFIHSLKSIKVLAKRSNLNMEGLIFDSNVNQFLASEQCVKGIPLLSDNSYFVEPSRSIFTKKQIKTFEQETKRLNKLQLGDKITLLLSK